MRERDRAEALDDYNHEMAGRDVGRMRRFLSEEQIEARSPEKRRGKQAREELSNLQAMLQMNAAYAELYNRTMDTLREAEQAAERALELAEIAHAARMETHRQLMERAAELDDGRKVFQDEEGQLWSEDEEPVSEEQALEIEWRGSEPTFEAFRDSRDVLTSSGLQVHTIRGYQVELGGYREELTSEDHPPGIERVEEIGQAIEIRLSDLRQPSSGQALERREVSSMPIPKFDG